MAAKHENCSASLTEGRNARATCTFRLIFVVLGPFVAVAALKIYTANKHRPEKGNISSYPAGALIKIESPPLVPDSIAHGDAEHARPDRRISDTRYSQVSRLGLLLATPSTTILTYVGMGSLQMQTLNLMARIYECEKQARIAPNPEARILWKRMEEFWRERITRPEPTMTFEHLRHGHKSINA